MTVFAAAADGDIRVARALITVLTGEKGAAIVQAAKALDPLTDEQCALVSALFALREAHIAADR
jgi:hypothetical protein